MLHSSPSRRRLLGLITLVLLLIIATDALATGPNGGPGLQVLQPKIHYQARLVDPATGQPRPDGVYTLHFALYATETGGSSVWAENWTGVVNDGMVSVMLGSSLTIDASLFETGTQWLGVAVDSEPEMTPRQEIGWVPKAIHAYHATYANYADDALNASDCDTVDGNDASEFALNDHSHATLPDAYGVVASDGSVHYSSGNFSVKWSSSLSAYEITFDDFDFHYLYDLCQVSLVGDAGLCPAGATIRLGSTADRLVVLIVESSGHQRKCPFHFVVWSGGRYSGGSY